jgi:hypothetical protein
MGQKSVHGDATDRIDAVRRFAVLVSSQNVRISFHEVVWWSLQIDLDRGLIVANLVSRHAESFGDRFESRPVRLADFIALDAGNGLG